MRKDTPIMNTINDLKIKGIVNRIGREAFITIFYPEIKLNPDITSKEIAVKYPDRKYTDKSWNSRTSKSKRLFKEGLEEETLRYIIESSGKIDADIVKKAESYLNQITGNLIPSL